MNDRRPVVTAIAVVAFVLAAALAATVAPLLAYTTSLACFGLAHVVVELRYVDSRFGRRLPVSLWAWSAALIGIVVLLRALRLGGVDLPSGIALEVLVVAALVVVGAVLARTTWPAVGAVGVACALALVAGVVMAPLEALLTLALLHNLTPLGFIVERAAEGRRAMTAIGGTVIFVAVPLLVASGLPTRALADVVDLDTAFASAGPLRSHLGVYLWPAWQASDAAVPLFSAAVCAQLLHYGAVIVWLPRTLGSAEQPRLPWPSWRALVALLVVFGGGLAAHFAVDFAGARGAYGLPAAVHAWIELPVLLMAFSAWRSSSSSPPTSS